MSTAETRVFPLAPMSPPLCWLTAALLPLPVLLAAVGLSMPSPARAGLLGAAGLLAVLWVAVWLWWRPSRFEVMPHGLSIVWPARRRDIPASDLAAARLLNRGEFRPTFGWAVRIGVGGLWGAFGLLWTSRGGLIDVYVSRLDRWVLIERRSARPLLVSPARADEFVDALRRRA